MKNLSLVFVLGLGFISTANAKPLQCGAEAIDMARVVMAMENPLTAANAKFTSVLTGTDSDSGMEYYTITAINGAGVKSHRKIAISESSDGGCVLAGFTRAKLPAAATTEASCEITALAITAAVSQVEDAKLAAQIIYTRTSSEVVAADANGLVTYNIQGLKADGTKPSTDRQVVLFPGNGCELISYTLPGAG